MNAAMKTINLHEIDETEVDVDGIAWRSTINKALTSANDWPIT